MFEICITVLSVRMFENFQLKCICRGSNVYIQISLWNKFVIYSKSPPGSLELLLPRGFYIGRLNKGHFDLELNEIMKEKPLDLWLSTDWLGLLILHDYLHQTHLPGGGSTRIGWFHTWEYILQWVTWLINEHCVSILWLKRKVSKCGVGCSYGVWISFIWLGYSSWERPRWNLLRVKLPVHF